MVLITGIGLAWLLGAPHPPAVPERVADRAALEAYLERLAESGAPPGLSVAVIRDGKTIYAKSFGIADGTTGAPATNDTVYHWYSVTKLVTAAAILRLRDQGRLDLDQPVAEILPFFAVTGPSPEAPIVTIRHLLNHTSGVPDPVPDIIGWIHREDVTPDQTALVKKHLPRFSELDFAPGTDRAYSNLGYMVLGAIIEAVTGERFESHVLGLFRPLGLARSDFLYTPELARTEAAGSHPVVHFFTPLLPFLTDMDMVFKRRIGRFYWLHRIYVDATPPTGLLGPVSDLARLAPPLMEAGPLLSEKSLALMIPPAGQVPLGWAEFDQGTRPWLQHRGGGPGFAANLRIYPKEKLGIAILSNSTVLDAEALADLLAGMNW